MANGLDGFGAKQQVDELFNGSEIGLLVMLVRKDLIDTQDNLEYRGNVANRSGLHNRKEALQGVLKKLETLVDNSRKLDITL